MNGNSEIGSLKVWNALLFIVILLIDTLPESKLLITFELDGLLRSKKTGYFFWLTKKESCEFMESSMYRKAKIGSLKFQNSLLFIVIFNRYLS